MWQKVDFIRQQVMDQEEAPKHFPKPNFHQKNKKSYGQCLAVCCPPDPLQLSESQQNHYIWEVCSANQWDALKTATPAASIGQQKGPNSSPHAQPYITHQCFKSWTNWATKFCLICCIHTNSCHLTTTSSRILTTFCKENASTASRRQKMLSKSSLTP